jgi:hypothetical protein
VCGKRVNPTHCRDAKAKYVKVHQDPICILTGLNHGHDTAPYRWDTLARKRERHHRASGAIHASTEEMLPYAARLRQHQ